MLSRRHFTLIARLRSVLPSSTEMKSGALWSVKSPQSNADASSTTDGSFTRDLVSLAQSIENAQPPLKINLRNTRRFREGEAYEAFDFSSLRVAMDALASRKKPSRDPFERTGIDPRNLYTMPEVLSLFINSSGQILPRSETGCNAQNQKKLSMAIKNARVCGLLSSTHKLTNYLRANLL